MALQNHVSGIRALIPGLLGGRNPTVPSGREASSLVHAAKVSNGALATYVVPADFPEQTDQWFLPDQQRYAPSPDSEFEYFIDAKQAYPAMKEAMETATGAGHYILLLGWTIHIDFDVLEASDGAGLARAVRPAPAGEEAPSERTIDAILRRKTSAGVMVRVLIWSQVMARQNDPENAPGPLTTAIELLAPRGEGDAVQSAADAWRALSPGLVIRADPDNHSPFGSHHHKIMLVNGNQGLIAFYGGLDFNPDRTRNTNPGDPQHDIHARVRGPAADSILELARERWDRANPVSDTMEGVPDGRYLSDLPATAPLPATREPRVRVQIGHTVGNPHIEQEGWRSNTWPMIHRAIERAQRFIYVEDQYFFSEVAMTALAAALPRLAHLTILVPGDRFQAVIRELRHWALKGLLEQTAPEHHPKIGLYERTGSLGAYIHAKSWVFDDEVAIIGSANCNRRGYESDSEIIGLTSDLDWSDATGRRGGVWSRLELDVARSLRMSMWAKHLGVLREDVVDGVASAYLWRRREGNAQVTEYQPFDFHDRAPLDANGRPVPWQTFVRTAPDASNNWLGRTVIDPPRASSIRPR